MVIYFILLVILYSLFTAWMDNIKTWTGLSVEESIRMTKDRDKWRKYVHGVANPRIEDESIFSARIVNIWNSLHA